MLITVSDQIEIKSVPASEAWELYSTLTYVRVILELNPEHFEKIEVLEDNNGKAGTVLLVYLKPGEDIPAIPVKEIFAVVDDEKRVKVVEFAKGWIFNNGFIMSLRIIYKIIEKPKKEGEEEEEESCIFEFGVECEARDLVAPMNTMQQLMQNLELMNKRIAEYLITNKNNKST